MFGILIFAGTLASALLAVAAIETLRDCPKVDEALVVIPVESPKCRRWY